MSNSKTLINFPNIFFPFSGRNFIYQPIKAEEAPQNEFEFHMCKIKFILKCCDKGPTHVSVSFLEKKEKT